MQHSRAVHLGARADLQAEAATRNRGLLRVARADCSGAICILKVGEFVSTNDEFCIKSDELCILNDDCFDTRAGSARCCKV